MKKLICNRAPSGLGDRSFDGQVFVMQAFGGNHIPIPPCAGKTYSQ